MTRDEAIRRIEAGLDQQLSRFATALTEKVAAGEIDLDAAADAHEVALVQQQEARAFCLAQLDAAEKD